MDDQKQSKSNEKEAYLETTSTSSAILHFNGRHLQAVIGRSGIRVDHREGDGSTPVGIWPLRRLFYRADRLNAPHTKYRCDPLSEDDGWCDDATHPDYNRQIRLPHPASHERLWRDNHTYDIIGVLGHNDQPIVPGLGSAIFLHVATPDYKPTEGCISLALPDLIWVLEQGLEAIVVPK